MSRTGKTFTTYPPDSAALQEREPFIISEDIDFDEWSGEKRGDQLPAYPLQQQQQRRCLTRRRLRVLLLSVTGVLALGALGAVFGDTDKVKTTISSTLHGDQRQTEQVSDATEETGQASESGNESKDWSWDRVWDAVPWRQEQSNEQEQQSDFEDDEATANDYASEGLDSIPSSAKPAQPSTSMKSMTTEDDDSDFEFSALETRPDAPKLIARPPRDSERFLSYNPHSGFHNQRIALSNAILLANMLNRTLIMPHARLGRAVSWKSKNDLQAVLERGQKSAERAQRCLDGAEVWSGTAPEGLEEECGDYDAFAEVSWSLLVDLSKTGTKVPLIDRKDFSRAWYTSPDGLNISEDSILAIDDTTSYDYKLYAAQEGLDNINQPGTEGIDNYAYPLPIADLQTPEAESKRLIEFGSLYGSFRINLQGADESWSKLFLKIQKAMMFDLDLLGEVSSQMADLMGGQENFVGLHLRVGDGSFKATANKRMHLVLLSALRSIFRLEDGFSRELEQWALAQRNSRRADRQNKSRSKRHLSSALGKISSIRRSDEATLSCPRPLHTDPRMSALNAHVYIATDARHPREEPSLSSFFTLLPCAHVLADFEEHLPALKNLQELYSEEERVPMFKFLVPFLEGETAARGARVLGTSGSTFSRFVVTVLHSHYWPDKLKQGDAIEALWAGLKGAVGYT